MAHATRLLQRRRTVRSPRTTGPGRCRAASASAWPWRGRSSGSRALVLCDEPTGNLDQASADAVAALLLDLHRSLRNILVVVTHSARLAALFPVQFEIANARLERIPKRGSPRLACHGPARRAG